MTTSSKSCNFSIPKTPKLKETVDDTIFSVFLPPNHPL